MRLLNTTTLKLHSFFGKDIPDYAVLSHRWEDEEVLFQDLKDGRGPGMPGYAKIEGCCAQARTSSLEYAWIDTCCIDKSSSTELSEAINSMYQWYKDAKVCYAYLSDVNSNFEISTELKNSAWFTRGWTLQELLAPERLIFFDWAWNDIGTKNTLEDIILKITGIQSLHSHASACIAEKMSWASKRKTTRVEDEAYCLMGLFDVNMPLLYGEGKKAFKRLQLEIIKSSDDESIFAWCSNQSNGDVFASSPQAFEFSGEVRMRSSVDDLGPISRERHPFTMTNKGLHISLVLIPEKALEDQKCPPWVDQSIVYVSLLHCMRAKDKDSALAILLHLRLDQEAGKGQQNINWSLHRIESNEILAVNLKKLDAESTSWLSKYEAQMASLYPKSQGKDHPMYPKSRLIYITQGYMEQIHQPYGYFAMEKTQNAHYKISIARLPDYFGLSRRRARIIINQMGALLKAGFEAKTTNNLYSRRWHGCLDAHGTWAMSREPYGLNKVGARFEPMLKCTVIYMMDETQFPHIYLKNTKTREIMLLIFGFPYRGLPWLIALTLTTIVDMGHYGVTEIMSQWLSTEESGARYPGTDRISLPLKDGSSVSLALSHSARGEAGQHFLDVTTDRYGRLSWPAQRELRAFTEWLTKTLLERAQENARAKQERARAKEDVVFNLQELTGHLRDEEERLSGSKEGNMGP